MVFSDSGWKDFPDTGRSTGVYIIFYQGVPIYHLSHNPGTVAQSNSENSCNAECTAGMTLEHSRMLIHELLNKNTDIVTEAAPLIILYGKSSVCMVQNGKGMFQD